jgi:hypothetical protein
MGDVLREGLRGHVDQDPHVLGVEREVHGVAEPGWFWRCRSAREM